MVPTPKIKTPKIIKIKGYPRGMIINPPTSAPIAVAKGEKTVSTAADSPVFSLSLAVNNPERPDPTISEPAYCPIISKNAEKKLRIPENPPKSIEKIPTIWLPKDMFFSLLNFAILLIIQIETGTKTRDKTELKTKIWLKEKPRFFKNKTKKALLNPAKSRTKNETK